MDPLHEIQRRQLRLIESASINEACAIDLLSLLRRLTAAEANNVLNMITLLQSEAEFLRRLSKEMAIRDYGMLAG
ncbi:hypothetical protein RCO22_27415 [Pseudomonas yamanorum]|jgi:hypothetical protein|uniref:Uncharacterized protein n=1 Tax=Pseudomonas yamanorum TaxID=515393 RepID=A0A143GFK6_9PSED|nr:MULTISPECIES: hypothetical protein [Pseudomonas]AMW82910.1 hypothetical protein AK972_2110 [Pseudomonas yamanorum]MBK5411781.1 hypothetical protein [Pseudomonas sp. TH34]MBV6663863.1 hypothetical protein [Pseudomonas yamanorum]MDR0192685.1 hypothetical protein [Pseudomonas yamanorum]NWD45907.1 hypothetical protein [Pseudomonas yamanorum]